MRKYKVLYIAVGESLHAVVELVDGEERRSVSKPDAFTDDHFCEVLTQGTVVLVTDNDDVYIDGCVRTLKLHPSPCGQPK